MRHTTRVTVVIGDDVVTLRRSGSTQPIVANILGGEKDGQGNWQRIWLDRFIHRITDEFQGWSASGAVVTELVRVGSAEG